MDLDGFMRLNGGCLETSVTTYQKGSSGVTLIACDHLAEQDYFSALEDIAAVHDLVVYEPFTRGEGDGRTPNGLISQAYAIDYSSLPAQWVDGEQDVRPTLGDRLLGALVPLFAMPLMPRIAGVMREASSGDRASSNAAKLSLFTDWPLRQFNTLVGLSTAARRRAALETLGSLEAEGKSISLLYGAGHAPYLERSLLERGYVETGKEWLASVGL